MSAEELEKAELRPASATDAADITEDGKLVTEEETAEGHVGWPARKTFSFFTL